MPQVIFGALLCKFTNNIHVSVKNSSAEGTCIGSKTHMFHIHIPPLLHGIWATYICGTEIFDSCMKIGHSTNG